MVTREKIPAWALPYLVNGDPTGLEGYEKEMVDDWYCKNDVEGVYPDAMGSEDYFSRHPAFGLPTQVVDCIVIISD